MLLANASPNVIKRRAASFSPHACPLKLEANIRALRYAAQRAQRLLIFRALRLAYIPLAPYHITFVKVTFHVKCLLN